MTESQAGRWLSKALHNRLLDRWRRLRRMKLVDDQVLDAIPDQRRGDETLESQDCAQLVERVLGRLTRRGRTIATELLSAKRSWRRRFDSATENRSMSARTRGRERAKVRGVLGAVVKGAGLSHGEAIDLLHALAAALAEAQGNDLRRVFGEKWPT